jgi:sortase B
MKAGAGTVIALSALVVIALILIPHEVERAGSKPTDGRLADTPAIVAANGEQTETPGIDWDYWHSVNPDIVGWITIPGSSIDHPVVQARPDDPTHYLDYDIYGNRNLYGCLYIDAESGITQQNAIIFGHNMGGIDDGMFTVLTNYLDASYLEEHVEVIIQTPERMFRLKVRAADVVNPYGFTKEIAFSDVEALRKFYLDIWNTAEVRSKEPASGEIDQLFTLITCGDGGATRTVVYVG